MEPTQGTDDVWSEWVLHRRHGGDAAFAKAVRAQIARIADRVLDAARLAPGMTLVDVGSGEGLLAWRAIERVGPALRVMLSDVSPQLLAQARLEAAERGALAQCTFSACAAERLTGIADASADAVTSRAVLAYVADKPAALREMHRVLAPGGRLSVAEPVFRDEALRTIALRQLFESRPAGSRDRFLELMLRWRSAQFPDTENKAAASPITNYTERDLVGLAQAAGFTGIHVELHLDLGTSRVPSWEVFLDQSPHPWAPSLRSVLEAQFSADEARLLEQVLRPAIDAGQSQTMDAVAYLQAVKPLG